MGYIISLSMAHKAHWCVCGARSNISEELPLNNLRMLTRTIEERYVSHSAYADPKEPWASSLGIWTMDQWKQMARSEESHFFFNHVDDLVHVHCLLGEYMTWRCAKEDKRLEVVVMLWTIFCWKTCCYIDTKFIFYKNIFYFIEQRFFS